MELSKSLKHKIQTTDSEGNTLFINLRLSDECKNGHQDFSITGAAYQKDKPCTDKWLIYGGCCHDEILKVRPDLELFVNLHLSNYKGVPMYCIENGFYFLKSGDLKTVSKHLRLQGNEIEQFYTCPDSYYFSYLIHKLDLPSRWCNEANEAIKLLQNWTGKTFEVDSPKMYNLHPEQVVIVDQKIEQGYYSPESIQKRKELEIQAKKQDQYNKLQKELDEVIKKHQLEYDVKRSVLDAGFSIENFIFYNHSKEAVFNWLSYKNKITTEDLEVIKQHPSIKSLGDTIKWSLCTKN